MRCEADGTAPPLISVIIPVYKTERFLEKCLRSVLDGDFQDIEVLLIDDASPGGKICDDFAHKDRRVRVIRHAHNKGLSAVRNEGIRQARGEYISFVDSDDWITSDMHTQLYALAKRYDADIASCGHMECVDGVPRNAWRINTNKARQTVVELLDGVSALKRMLTADSQITHTAWGKLYRRQLFLAVRYPEGRLYEDAATTYRLYRKADQVVHTATPYYCYAIHNKGISKRAFTLASMDKLLAAEEIVLDIGVVNPDLQRYAQCFLVVSALRLAADFTPQVMKSYPDEYAKINSLLIHHRQEKNPLLSRRHRLLLFLYRYCRPAFMCLWRSRLQMAYIR